MTKKELIEKSITIRDRYRLGTPISDNDKQFMIDEVFKYHPEWKQKNQKTIKEVIINKNWNCYNTPCFFLVYEDKTYDDISFRWSIKHRPSHTLQ